MDTCDKCGPEVRALVRADIGGSYLTYCASCTARYWPGLVEAADDIRPTEHGRESGHPILRLIEATFPKQPA